MVECETRTQGARIGSAICAAEDAGSRRPACSGGPCFIARRVLNRPAPLVPSAAVPIYEYRCPNGHHFERFQAMTAPAPEACDECGASPVELVLYPVAIHYKGSGFYTTDYGKGKKAARDRKSVV